MTDVVRLKPPAHVSQPLTPEAAEEVVKSGPARADAVDSMARSVRRLTWMVGLGGVALALIATGALVYVVKTDDPPRHHFSTIDPTTGRVQAAVSATDAPALFTQGTAHQYLRMFVETCASYIHELRNRHYERCTALMAPDQQSRYRDDFTLSNPRSPQNTIGANGSITAEGLTFVPQPQSERSRIQSWRVHYTAVVRSGTREVSREPQVATVHFEWRPDMRMTPQQRSWNTAGMRVISYNFDRDTSR